MHTAESGHRTKGNSQDGLGDEGDPVISAPSKNATNSCVKDCQQTEKITFTEKYRSKPKRKTPVTTEILNKHLLISPVAADCGDAL